MKKSSFSKHSDTDRDFLHNAKGEDIDLSDIPEVTEEQIARAVMRVGGKPVPEGDADRLRRIIARTLAFIRENVRSVIIVADCSKGWRLLTSVIIKGYAIISTVFACDRSIFTEVSQGVVLSKSF